jgi:hypothetical protein
MSRANGRAATSSPPPLPHHALPCQCLCHLSVLLNCGQSSSVNLRRSPSTPTSFTPSPLSWFPACAHAPGGASGGLGSVHPPREVLRHGMKPEIQ